MKTIDARFFAKVHMTDGCWIWTGAVVPRGYGKLYVNGRVAYAHRIAYEQMIGPIPTGHEVDHLCFNTGCVRPDHLDAVDHAENVRRWGASIEACPKGHAYTPENTVRERGGNRKCRTCRRALLQRWRAKRRAA